VRRAGRFLIVTWEGGGNIPPAIALGCQLGRGGHDVRLLGPGSVGGAVSAAGLRFVPYASVPAWPEGVILEDDLGLVDTLLNGDGVVRDVVEEARREPPDVLVVDCMMGGGLAAAEHVGIRTAVLVHVLYRPFVEVWGQLVVSAAPRARLGLAPVDGPVPAGLLARADAVLVLVPPGFDFGEGSCPSNTTYTGPVFLPDPGGFAWDLPWPPQSSDPLVLVSFGTTFQRQRQGLAPVLEALAELPVRGLLTLGGVLSPEELVTPPNVTVRAYVPHAAVLPHTSLVVSHGGLSTIMAALAHAVPLLCLPQGREQGLNAERVEAVDAGRTLAMDADPGEIAAAVTAMIQDPGYRRSAAAMAERIAQAEGAAARLAQSLLV
jgi:UDP:flavonoid glycosyltransferase YjiC (YdhE family)